MHSASQRHYRLTRKGAALAAAAAVGAVLAIAGLQAAWAGEPICGLEEHAHTDACYEQQLTCAYADADDELLEADGHVHGEECYESVLACGLEEHEHTEACYESEADEAASSEEDVSSVAADDDEDDEEDVGYIQTVSFTQADGTAPFDLAEDDGTDAAGNDSSASNNIVRSFDSISYTFSLVLSPRFESTAEMPTSTIDFQAELDLDLTEARFDVSEMTWLDDDWSITYYDEGGDVVLVQTESGLVNASGKSVSSFNSVVDDDTSSGYSSSVVRQVLSGSYYKKANGAATMTLEQIECVVQVLAATNGTQVQPSFSFWIDGNEENVDGEGETVDATLEGDDVAVTSVSAAPRYNITVKSASYTSVLGWYDFTSGEGGSSDDGSSVYGRMVAYGITIELFNETNNPDIDLDDKGVMGIELPVGTIGFDLTLQRTSLPSSDNSSDSSDLYTPVVWEYNENVSVTSIKYDYQDVLYCGNWGRNMYWRGASYTATANSGAPYNTDYSGGSSGRYCYDGGQWSITSITYDDTTYDSPSGSDVTLVTGDGSNATYHFEVSGFDFDFDFGFDADEGFDIASVFPEYAASDSGTKAWLEAGYIGAFSAGHVQVLQQINYENRESTNSFNLSATLSNFTATSASGTSVEEEAALTSDGYGGDENVSGNDNTLSRSITIYTRGSIMKVASFTKSTSTGFASSFLGTNFWSGPSYDASAYLGQSIGMWGSQRSDSGSDAYERAVNILQVFDSEVLEINGTPTYYGPVSTSNAGQQSVGLANGTASFLYAADPLYPDGYDSNDEDEMARMNAVREEDLLYFESVEELEEAGYTCVAVLAEIRGCKLMGEQYTSVKWPLKVRSYTLSSERAATAEDGTVDESQLVAVPTDGTTVCTVNAVRVWMALDDSYDDMDDVSWADATITASNIGSETEIDNTISTLSGTALSEVEGYVQSANTKAYVKTEYDEDGNRVSGTHTGTSYGMSLVTMGYTSSVSLDVANEETGKSTADDSTVTFDYGEGEAQASYTVGNIATSVDGEETDATTSLTISVELADELLIVHESDSFAVVGVDASTGEACTYTFGPSKSSRSGGTEVSFEVDGTIYTYTITAVVASDYTSVTFYLDDVPIGVELPDIAFTATLTGAVVNNATYTASVTIQGDADTRPISEDNGTYDEASFKVVLLSATTVGKSVDETIVDVGESFTYTLSYANISSTASTTTYDVDVVDILPSSGDYWNEEFGGSFVVTSIVADFSDAPNTFAAITASEEGEGYVLYLSEDDDVSAYTESDVATIMDDGFTASGDGYTDATDAAGTWYLATTATDEEAATISWTSEDGAPLTALAVCPSWLCPAEGVDVYVTLAPVETVDEDGEVSTQQAGDLYHNVCYVMGSNGRQLQSNLVSTQVVERNIEGVAFEDADQDDVRTSADALLPGVTVSLYSTSAMADGDESTFTLEDGTPLYPAYDLLGNAVTSVVTDDEGAYTFSGLAAGTYVVVFTGEAEDGGVDFSTYSAATPNSGSDDMADSDAIGVTDEDGVLQYAYITGFVLPEVELMRTGGTGYLYESTDNDIGLSTYATLSFTKVSASDTATVLSGAAFSLYVWVGEGDAPSTAIDVSAVDEDEWRLVGTATSDEDGSVSFTGLDVGSTYRLVETTAPSGYVRPTGQHDIVMLTAAQTALCLFDATAVDGSNGASPLAFAVYTDASGNVTGYYLPNKVSTELPASGGAWWLWLVGAALLVLAAGVLFAQRAYRRAPRGAHSR